MLRGSSTASWRKTPTHDSSCQTSTALCCGPCRSQCKHRDPRQKVPTRDTRLVCRYRTVKLSNQRWIFVWSRSCCFCRGCNAAGNSEKLLVKIQKRGLDHFAAKGENPSAAAATVRQKPPQKCPMLWRSLVLSLQSARKWMYWREVFCILWTSACSDFINCTPSFLYGIIPSLDVHCF